jgi:hypothetical protein
MELKYENPKTKAISCKFTSKLNYKRVLTDANNKRLITDKKVKSKATGTRNTKGAIVGTR